MEQLWSMSTTIREASRIPGFIKTAIEMDGRDWTNAAQEEFQVRLIKNREYLYDPENTQNFNNLNEEQIGWLRDKTRPMTLEQAREIFDAKHYEDPAMRGRQSMKPLEKLGLVYRVDGKIVVSEVGYGLADGSISVTAFMREAFLKLQFPNPYEDSFTTWNTKPFINTLRLIKRVNELCRQTNRRELGISKLEFGIFVLSLNSYQRIDEVANRVLDFRTQYSAAGTEREKNDFFVEYVNDYLSDFKNPVKNVQEYTDNVVRYLRLTNLIHIRGRYSNTYIDLEPRRMVEINSILEHDNGAANDFSPEEWRSYMGVYGTYVLPYEAIDKLTEIAENVHADIIEIERRLGVDSNAAPVPHTNNREELKLFISQQRAYRTELQNLELKKQYQEDNNKIDEAIEALDGILKKKKDMFNNSYSIELEKWSNVALNILNDSIQIKPNTIVGDDNEPIFTAPGGVADIECYYQSFDAICEVTTLTGRDQWFNEGQPVMRHLRDFEDNNRNTGRPDYCIFIAPRLHPDTLETFFVSVQYGYKGSRQKIIPFSIPQIERILSTIKAYKNTGASFTNRQLKDLWDKCVDLTNISSSADWPTHIDSVLNNWSTQLLA